MVQPVTPMNAAPEPPQPSDPGYPAAGPPELRGSTAPPAGSHAAEAAGEAVGSAVVAARHLPQRLQQVKHRLSEATSRAGRELRSSADEFTRKASRKLSLARSRAARLSHEYPLGTVMAAAALGLVLGFALRLWRDNRG